MDIDYEKAVGGGIFTLLGLIVTWLFTARGSNKVKNDNASNDRQSRFEDNLQQRYDNAMGRISELTKELDSVKARLAEADKRLTVVQMIADNDPMRAIEFSKDSAFVDLSRPMRTRTPPRPSPSDPFQAADPYAPPVPKKPK